MVKPMEFKCSFCVDMNNFFPLKQKIESFPRPAATTF